MLKGGLQSTGGNRIITKTFRAVAEAYKIVAVSLTSAGLEKGGSEIDFGILILFKCLRYLKQYFYRIRTHPCGRLCCANDENGQQREIQDRL